MFKIPLSLKPKPPSPEQLESDQPGPDHPASDQPATDQTGDQQGVPFMGAAAIALGILGIFTKGYIFVPLAFICSLVALVPGPCLVGLRRLAARRRRPVDLAGAAGDDRDQLAAALGFQQRGFPLAGRSTTGGPRPAGRFRYYGKSQNICTQLSAFGRICLHFADKCLHYVYIFLK